MYKRQVEWFARAVMGWTATECGGVVYVTDHFAELSAFMADLIRDLLTDRAFPENFIDEALQDRATAL